MELLTTKEWADLVIEFLRIVVSWPLVILVLGLIFFHKFRENIADLIKRLAEFGFPGGGAKFTQPPAGGSPTPSLDDVRQRVEAERDFATQTALHFGKMWWFEKIWNNIYKSQIEILEALANLPQGGSIRWQDIHDRFYLPVVRAVPGFSAYPFPQYMSFLGNTANFVTWDLTVDPQNPPVTITTLGREFLTYMATQNYRKEMRIY